MTTSVTIIGGGVVGAACAYFLRRANCDVTIIEQHQFGSGCSHANCGFVCPSHVLPLATPAVLKEGIVSLFRPNGPLRVAPRFDLALWSWLWQFARNCYRSQTILSAKAIHALLQSSRGLFDQIIKDERLTCEWETRGILFVFASEKHFNKYQLVNQRLLSEFGIGAERLDRDALLTREPSLRDGLPGGWYFDTDAHLKPDRLMSELKALLSRQGVSILENSPVTGFTISGTKITAIRISDSEVPTDQVVIAAGAWSPILSRQLGFRLPIQPGKGYSITFSKPDVSPKQPLIFEEHRVAITPFRDSLRVGSTMEFAGYDTTLNHRRLNYLLDVANSYLCTPLTGSVLHRWYGWRPMTPDSVPIIDRSPAFSNLFLATGHNMLGVAMAPATGKLLAELLTNSTPHLDPAPYSMKRFLH